MPSTDLSDIDGKTPVSSLPCYLRHPRTQSSSSRPANIIDIDDKTVSEPEVEDLVSDSGESAEPSDRPAAKKRKKRAIHEDDVSEDGLSTAELALRKCMQYHDPGMLTDCMFRTCTPQVPGSDL